MLQDLLNTRENLKQQLSNSYQKALSNPSDLNIRNIISSLENQIKDLDNQLAYNPELRELELQQIMSDPSNLLSPETLKKALDNTTALKHEFALRNDASAIYTNLTGSPLYDYGKLLPFYGSIAKDRTQNTNTKSDSWEDNQNVFVRTAVDAVKGVESFGRSLYGNLRYGKIQKNLFEEYTNLGENNINSIQALEQKKDHLSRLQQRLSEEEKYFADNYATLGKFERENSLNRQNALRAELSKYQLTSEDQALDSSPIKAEYDRIRAEQASVTAQKNSIVNGTALSYINEDILPDSETRSALTRELDETELEKVRQFYGDDYSLIQNVWDTLKLEWKHTSLGQAIGSVLPSVLVGRIPRIGMAMLFGSTTASNYYEALNEQFERNPTKALEETRALIGGAFGAFVDIAGTKYLIDEPTKQIAKRLLTGTYSKYAREAEKVVSQRLDKLGVPVSQGTKQALIQKELEQSSDLFVAEVATKLVGDSNSKLRILGQHLLNMNSNASKLVGAGISTADKAVGFNNKVLRNVGLSAQDILGASAGMTFENVGATMATKYAGGVDLADMTNPENLQELIQSGAQGFITGGMYHPVGVGLSVGTATAGDLLEGVQKYKPVESSYIDHMLSSGGDNVSSEELQTTVDGMKNVFQTGVKELQQRLVSNQEKAQKALQKQSKLTEANKGIPITAEFDEQGNILFTGLHEGTPDTVRTFVEGVKNDYNASSTKIREYMAGHEANLKRFEDWEIQKLAKTFDSDTPTSEGLVKAFSSNPETIEKFNKLSDPVKDRFLRDRLKIDDSTSLGSEASRIYNSFRKAFMSSTDEDIQGSSLDSLDFNESQKARHVADVLGLQDFILEAMSKEQLQGLANLNLEKDAQNNDFSVFENSENFKFINEDLLRKSLAQEEITFEKGKDISTNELLHKIQKNPGALDALINQGGVESLLSERAEVDDASKNYPGELASAVKEILKDSSTNLNDGEAFKKALFNKTQIWNNLEDVPDSIHKAFTIGGLRRFVDEWNKSRDAEAEFVTTDTAEEAVKLKQEKLAKDNLHKVYKAVKGKYFNQVYLTDLREDRNKRMEKNIQELDNIIIAGRKGTKSEEEFDRDLYKTMRELTATLTEFYEAIEPSLGQKEKEAFKSFQENMSTFENQTEEVQGELVKLAMQLSKHFSVREEKAIQDNITKAGRETPKKRHQYNQAILKSKKKQEIQAYEKERENQEKQYTDTYSEFYKNEGKLFSGKDRPEDVDELLKLVYRNIYSANKDLVNTLPKTPTNNDFANLGLSVTQATVDDLPQFITHLSYLKNHPNFEGREAELDQYIKFIQHIQGLVNSDLMKVLPSGGSAFTESYKGVEQVSSKIREELIRFMNALRTFEENDTNFLANAPITEASQRVSDLVYMAQSVLGKGKRIKPNSVPSELLKLGVDTLINEWGKIFNDTQSADSDTYRKPAKNFIKLLDEVLLAEGSDVFSSIADKVIAEADKEVTKTWLKNLQESGRTPENSFTNLLTKDQGSVLFDLLGSSTIQKILGLKPVSQETAKNFQNSKLSVADWLQTPEGYTAFMKDSATVYSGVESRQVYLPTSPKKKGKMSDIKSNLTELTDLIMEGISAKSVPNKGLSDVYNAVILLQLQKSQKGIGEFLAYPNTVAFLKLLPSLGGDSTSKLGKKVQDSLLKSLKKSPEILPEVANVLSLGSTLQDSEFIKDNFDALLYNAYRQFLIENLPNRIESKQGYSALFRKGSKISEMLETLANLQYRLTKSATPYNRYDASKESPKELTSTDANNLLRLSIYPWFKENAQPFTSESVMEAIKGFVAPSEDLSKLAPHIEEFVSILNKFSPEITRVDTEFTQKELNTLYSVVYGEGDFKGIAKLLQLPNSYNHQKSKSSTQSKNKPEFSKSSTNPFLGKFFKKTACFGAGNNLYTLLSGANDVNAVGQALETIAQVADYLRDVDISSEQREVFSKYFDTDFGINPKIFEVIAGVSLANLNAFIGKEQSEDFLNKLKNQNLANEYIKNGYQDTGTVNQELGAEILRATGCTASGGDKQTLIGLLGGLGIIALRQMGAIDFAYVGVNSSGIPITVPMGDSGKKKRGLTLCLTPKAQTVRDLTDLVSKCTYITSVGRESNILGDAYQGFNKKLREPSTLGEMKQLQENLAEEFDTTYAYETYTEGDVSVSTDNVSGITRIASKSEKASVFGDYPNPLKEGEEYAIYVPRHLYIKADGVPLTGSRLLTVVRESFSYRLFRTKEFLEDFEFLKELGTYNGKLDLNHFIEEISQSLFSIGEVSDEIAFLRNAIEYEPIEAEGFTEIKLRNKYISEAIALFKHYQEVVNNPKKYGDNNTPGELFYPQINTQNNRVYVEASVVNYREAQILRQYFDHRREITPDTKITVGGEGANDITITRLFQATFLHKFGLDYDKMTLTQIDATYNALMQRILEHIPKRTGVLSTKNAFSAIEKINEALKGTTYETRGEKRVAKDLTIAKTMESVRALKVIQANSLNKAKFLELKSPVTFDYFPLKLEIDGLCNGASLKLLSSLSSNADNALLQAVGLYISKNPDQGADNALLQAVGLYISKNPDQGAEKIKSFVESGVNDLYEQGALEAIHEALDNYVTDIVDGYGDNAPVLNMLKLTFDAEGTTTGSLKEIISRSFIKTPFTGENYGAGLKAIDIALKMGVSDIVSKLLYKVIHDNSPQAVTKFKEWVYQAIEANNGAPIQFTHIDGSSFKVTKDGNIVSDSKGALNGKNVFTNPEYLTGHDFDITALGNMNLSDSFTEAFSQAIYKGIDVLRAQSAISSNILTGVSNSVATTIASLAYKKLKTLGVFAKEGTNKALGDIVEEVVNLLNPVLTIGSEGSATLSLTRNKASADVARKVVFGLLRTKDGKVFYKPRAYSILPVSSGSATPPTATHTVDGNIIQDIADSFKENMFLGIHDAVEVSAKSDTTTKKSQAEKVSQSMNKKVFFETTVGEVNTLNSAISLLQRCFAVASQQGVSLPTEVQDILQRAEEYKTQYSLTVLNNLREYNNILANNGTITINQYQLTGVTGYSLTKEDINDAITGIVKALGNSGEFDDLKITDLGNFLENLSGGNLTTEIKQSIISLFYTREPVGHSLKPNEELVKEAIKGSESLQKWINHTLKQAKSQIVQETDSTETDIDSILSEISKKLKEFFEKADKKSHVSALLDLIGNAYSVNTTSTVTDSNTLLQTLGIVENVQEVFGDAPESAKEQANIQARKNFVKSLLPVDWIYRVFKDSPELLKALGYFAVSADGRTPQTEFLNTLQALNKSGTLFKNLFKDVYTNLEELSSDTNFVVRQSEMDFDVLKNTLARQKIEKQNLNIYNSNIDTSPDYADWFNAYLNSIDSRFIDTGKPVVVVLTMRNQEDILYLTALQQLKQNNPTKYQNVKILITPSASNTEYFTGSEDSNIKIRDMDKLNSSVRALHNISRVIKQNKPDATIRYAVDVSRNKFKDPKVVEYVTGHVFNEATVGAKISAFAKSMVFENGRVNLITPPTSPDNYVLFRRDNAGLNTSTSSFADLTVSDLSTIPLPEDYSDLNFNDLRIRNKRLSSMTNAELYELSQQFNTVIGLNTDSQNIGDVGKISGLEADINHTNNATELLSAPNLSLTIRTSSSGTILDKRARMLFSGSPRLQRVKADYENQLKKRKDLFDKGLISEADLKRPVFVKTTTLGLGTTEVMFVPFIDDTISIKDLRNAITRTDTDNLENVRYTIDFNVGRISEVFESRLLTDNEAKKQLFDIVTNPKYAENALLFPSDLPKNLAQRHIRRESPRHTNTSEFAGISLVYARAMAEYFNFGSESRNILYVDTFNDTKMNTSETTVMTLAHKTSVSQTLVDLSQKGINAMPWLSKIINQAVNWNKHIKVRGHQQQQHGYSSNSLGEQIRESQFKDLDTGKITALMDFLEERDATMGISSTWLKDTLGKKLLGLIQPLKVAIMEADNTTGFSRVSKGTTYVGMGISDAPGTSALEVFLHEALVHPVMEFIDTDAGTNRKASQLFRYVMNNITADMFDCDATHAQDILNYIKGKQGNEAIAEFFAYATTNADFRNAMSKLRATPEATGTIFSRVNSIVNRVFHYFSGDKSMSAPANAVSAVDRVFNDIYMAFNAVKALQKSQETVSGEKKLSLIEKADRGLYELTIKGLSKISPILGESLRVKKNLREFNEIQGIPNETIGNIVLDFGEKLTQKATEFSEHREEINKYLSEVFTSLKGTTQDNWDYIKLRLYAKQSVDTLRQRVIGEINKAVEEIIKEIPTKTRNQLVRSFIRTDVSALFASKNQITERDAINLIKDSKFRKAQIESLERKILHLYKMPRYLINASKGLASYMTRGINTSGLGYKNAYEIVTMTGAYTGNREPLTTAESDVDILTTLYAIDYTDSQKKSIYSEIPDDVIINLSKIHNAIKDWEFANTYGNYGQKYHIPKGQLHGGTPLGNMEVYSSEHKKALEWAHSVGSTITPTRLDPFFKSRQANLVTAYFPFRSSIPIEAGVFALTDLFGGRAGSGIKAGTRTVGSEDILQTSEKDARYYLTDLIQRLNSSNAPIIDANTVDGNFTPLMNAEGEVTGATFELNPITVAKKTRHHFKIHNVLGDIFGSAVERYQTVVTNRRSAQAIADIYESNKSNPNKEFVWVNGTSEQEELRVAYAHLPYEVKEFFTQKYRDRGMPILKGTLDHIMGKRITSSKILDTEYYKATKEAQSLRNKLLHYFRNGYVSLGEEGASYLTKVGKDFIVIKSLTVGLFNHISNCVLLNLKGIDPITMFKDMGEGLDQLTQLENYSKRIDALWRKRLEKTITPKEELETANLKKAMEALPIYPLYRDGILGTIAEDLSSSDRTLKDFIDSHLSGVPARIAHEVVIDQASTTYKFLRNFVNVGDKLGKYVLYKNLPKTMSTDEKYRELQDAFIDYGIPLPTGLDWLEAVGMANFMKYGLGIQKVILNTVTKSPSTSLLLALNGMGFMGAHVPNILDSALTVGTLNQGLTIPGFGIWVEGISSSPYARVL